MAKAKFRKLHKNICVAYARLIRSGDILCRQISGTEEAAERGAGYIYFGGRGGHPYPSRSALFLIENGLVEPVNDGLFAGSSQTFRPIAREAFDAFKTNYEAPANV
jgi:hypothetical protein